MVFNHSSTVTNITTEKLNATLMPAVLKSLASSSPPNGYILSQYSTGIRYTYITLLLITVVMIIVGNITLIAIICFYKKLHTATNVFITNLAIGDAIIAFTVVPFDIDQLIRGYFAFDKRICEVSNTIFFLSLPASTVNLSILTFERFCAIRFPLLHRTGRLFTTKRNIAIIVCAWAYTSVTACLPIMGWRSFPTIVAKGQCFFFFEVEYAVFQLIANFISPLLFIVVMNVWILQIARRDFGKKLTSRKHSVPGARAMLRKNSHGRSNSKSMESAIKRKISRSGSTSTQDANTKAAKIIAMLVGVFAFCWMPYIINLAANIACKGCSPVEVTTATMILVFFNSAINPILYGIYKPQIRSALKEVYNALCQCMNRRRGYENHHVDKEVELTCV